MVGTPLSTRHTAVKITAEQLVELQLQAELLPICDIAARLNDIERGIKNLPKNAPTDLRRPYEILRSTYRDALYIANGGLVCSKCGVGHVSEADELCVGCWNDQPVA